MRTGAFVIDHQVDALALAFGSLYGFFELVFGNRLVLDDGASCLCFGFQGIGLNDGQFLGFRVIGTGL